MKTTAIITALTAATLLSVAPATAQVSGFANIKSAAPADAATIVHKTGRRGGRIAAGVALGVLGIIAASQARAHYSERDDSHEYRCRRWRRWCRDGEDSACWKFDKRC